MTAQVRVDGEHHVSGEGSGPISAFVQGLRDAFDVDLDVVDYAEHAIGRGAEATAAAYVESIAGDDEATALGHRHRPGHHHRRPQGRPRRPRAPAALKPWVASHPLPR